MKKITQKELEVFLRKHKLWLEGKDGGEKANLTSYDLSGSDLRYSDLRGSDLRYSDLRGSDLRYSDLRGSDLRYSDLSGSDLRGSDLSGSDLRGSDLRDAKNLSLPISCPEEGEFIGFKKVERNLIVKLKITEDAKRCSATGRKCRCSKALVLSITNKDGSESGVEEVRSKYDTNFVYKVGETVEVKDFCDDRWKECSAGIHFFITRKEAEDY